MSTTSDPSDPRLSHGPDTGPADQAAAYLVLSEDELAKGFVRPLRRSYRHETCGAVTTMAEPIAATYATEPAFYGSTYCCSCRMHLPVGPDGEFSWIEQDGSDGPRVGT